MNVNDLMKRYKVSSQAIRKFVRLHLDEINENGIERLITAGYSTLRQ